MEIEGVIYIAPWTKVDQKWIIRLWNHKTPEDPYTPLNMEVLKNTKPLLAKYYNEDN